MKNVFEEFKWREQLFDYTEAAGKLLSEQKITVYNGFDPSGDSLHIGNLVPMMGLARLQRFGHTPIAVAGGGTGMIGDPSGKSSERNLLTLEQIEHNLASIKAQLSGTLDFESTGNPAIIVNNYDWLAPVKMMDFLRDVGKHFSVNYMTSKDSVRSRLDREGEGISYTEFSYMLLQAYDFMYLFEKYGCVMQAGGSDQWGNITAGIELIRRALGEKAHGICYPLITRSDGSKFGKTATGDNIWLDAKKTSPYHFYQFWFNSDDADVIHYLKTFTWLSRAEIYELEQSLLSQPEKRQASRRLAQEVTRMIHGETALARAEEATEAFFSGELRRLTAEEIRDVLGEVPSSQIGRETLSGEGAQLVELLANSSLASSKGDARRAIKGGGIYLNDQRVSDEAQKATIADSIEGQFLVLRKGRKRYHLLQIVD